MILDDIVAHKRHEVADRKSRIPLPQLQDQAAHAPAPRDFRAALEKPGISLIAEVKRASPSKGDMLPDADAVELAHTYEACGARAISVLTDTKYFKGTLDDLTKVHQNVSVPCLRKEFIIDEYQLHEARAAEADAVLLIVRILSDDELKHFHQTAHDLGLHVLVEAHTDDEVRRAADAGAHIIGINNRNLDTLEVSLDTTFRLQALVPREAVLVSESGIYTREDVERLEDGGIQAILVGESLLTSADVPAKIRELLGASG